MSQQEFFELADKYLREELNTVEKEAFEIFCAENPSYATQFSSHTSFLTKMQEAAQRRQVKNTLLQVAHSYHKNNPAHKTESQTRVISLWEKLRINVPVAAAVAIVAVFSTLWLSGYYKTIEKTTSDYSALKREINTVQRNINAHNVELRNMKDGQSSTTNVEQFGATGFMLTNDGYVVTNYHVIQGADSIYLQNNKGDSFKAQVIHTDATKDLAILFIQDPEFKNRKKLPYSFKSAISDLGEDIYTIGFPRDEAVYGQGYLSSATGYAGDTISYQISVPVNPGNSGGPVLDNKGNIIGIISGKQTGIDGAAFAIKTKTLLNAINEIPVDSLQGKININKRNALAGLGRTEQIKQMQNYIYMVKVY